MGDGFHDRKETHGHKHAIWTKSSVEGAYRETDIPSPNKNVDGIKFATKRSEENLFTTPVRRAGKGMRFSRIGRQKLRGRFIPDLQFDLPSIKFRNIKSVQHCKANYFNYCF